MRVRAGSSHLTRKYRMISPRLSAAGWNATARWVPSPAWTLSQNSSSNSSNYRSERGAAMGADLRRGLGRHRLHRSPDREVHHRKKIQLGIAFFSVRLPEVAL